jgi:ABC-type uncharacterized transport system permease subunit
MTTTLHSGGWLFYLAAAIAYFSYLAQPRAWLGNVATAILAIGFAGHTTCLIVQATGHGLPFSSQALVLSIFSWAIVAIYLGSQLVSKLTVIGAFVAPVATLIALLAEAAPGSPVAHPGQATGWLYAHIVTVTLGGGAFAVSFCVASIYLIQERYLKSKRLNGLFRRLPSLDSLDRLNQRAVVLGFVMLSLGLFAGAAWATIDPRPGYHIWADPLVLGAVALWGWYAFAVQSRMFGWRGRKSALFSVIGFVVMMVVSAVSIGLRGTFHT